MKSPAEKYRNDPQYRSLVDMLEHFIHTAHYTPSELREAATLACIRYETRRVRSLYFPIPTTIDKEEAEKVENALDVLSNFSKTVEQMYQSPRDYYTNKNKEKP